MKNASGGVIESYADDADGNRVKEVAGSKTTRTLRQAQATTFTGQEQDGIGLVNSVDHLWAQPYGTFK